MLEREPNVTQQVERAHNIMQRHQRAPTIERTPCRPAVDVRQKQNAGNTHIDSQKEKQTYNTEARTCAAHREQMPRAGHASADGSVDMQTQDTKCASKGGTSTV